MLTRAGDRKPSPAFTARPGEVSRVGAAAARPIAGENLARPHAMVRDSVLFPAGRATELALKRIAQYRSVAGDEAVDSLLCKTHDGLWTRPGRPAPYVAGDIYVADGGGDDDAPSFVQVSG
jgi:hypothetical protein